MSHTRATPATPGVPAGSGAPRRVRHQARDVAVVMAFSLGASLALAAALLVLTVLLTPGR